MMVSTWKPHQHQKHNLDRKRRSSVSVAFLNVGSTRSSRTASTTVAFQAIVDICTSLCQPCNKSCCASTWFEKNTTTKLFPEA